MKVAPIVFASLTCFLAVESARTLLPRAYDPLPAGSITPRGWLLEQLKLQAEGLSGHLSMFWDDVMNSVWVGGAADAGLHERTPYWLNGVVPLTYLLKNAGIEQLPAMRGIYKQQHNDHHHHHHRDTLLQAPSLDCVNGTDMMSNDITSFNVNNIDDCRQRCADTANCVGWVVESCNTPTMCWLKNANGATVQNPCRCYAVMPPQPAPPVNLTAQIHRYIDYLLSHAQSDGWLGPDDKGDGAAYWGRSNIILALAMFAEAERPDTALFKNITATMLNYMMAQKKRMETVPMTSWAAQRWMDMALGAQWLLLNAPQGREGDLWVYLDQLNAQGSDWESWFQTFTGDAGGHNVNNAQALKSAAVLYLQTGNTSLPQLSKTRMENLDRLYGLPTGMFNGDEILPDPATRNPSRGIELCGVVEAMYSYTSMFSVHGDLAFADRAELIAYNALPATWASPRGGDMWAHQYLQAINEINAVKADPHVWTHDGDMSETYGLEPNYGCCTANFHQGWPKFANMAVMESNKDHGVVVALLVPLKAVTSTGTVVNIDTAYPFEDTVTITVTPKPPTSTIYIRVPSWAGPSSTINGQTVTAGTMLQRPLTPGQTNKFVLVMKPVIRLEAWGDNGGDLNKSAVSVLRGALLYSLPIGANFTVYGHHFGSGDEASNDYYVTPTTPWNFALDQHSLAFQQGAYQPLSAPFNHTGWPVGITATVRAIPSWQEYLNSAAAPPASPACLDGSCGPPTKVLLVPHGGTDLRMGELPLSGL